MDGQEQPILLVDDEASDVELTRWAFENSGYVMPMVVARDGLEALDLLLPAGGGSGLNPVMVLMDVDMPRMGGVETVTRIRSDARTRMLPIIMLTGSVAQRDIVAASHAGANGYVQKPLDIEDFLRAASAIGVFWLGTHRTHGTPGRPGDAPASSAAEPHAPPPVSPSHTSSSGADRPGITAQPAQSSAHGSTGRTC